MEDLLSAVALLPIYLLFFFTWLIPGIEKLWEGVDAEFREQFGSSFIARFPGLRLAFYQIATLEVIAGFLFLVSLVRLEFLPLHDRPFLQWGLWLSLLIFALLSFGMRLIHNHRGSAELFFYFTGTAVLSVLVGYAK